MKRRPARFVALLVAALLPRLSNAQNAPAPLETFADSLMNAQLSRQHIPGAVLVVVRDGAIVLARGYGLADVERHVPVDAERTVFRVASVSKLVTATAAMQLVEQGRLDLRADVNRYLTRFKLPPSPGRSVTLFDLLTHTAGFDDANIARKAHAAADVGPLGDYLARRMPAIVRPPGTCIAYSNHGMALVGYLVEVASGMPFERYVDERVFAPLGMTRSSFALEPDSVASLATGYEGDPPRAQPRDYTRTIPASMLSTTGTDMARFMIAHLEPGRPELNTMLAESTMAAMHRRQFTQHPSLAGVGFGFWERYPQRGERALWHDGDASGFASLLYLLPERHIGYFMAFNSRAGNRARREVLAALLGRELPTTTPLAWKQEGVASLGERVAGTYLDTRSAHRTLEKLASIGRTLDAKSLAGGALNVSGIRYLPIELGVFGSEDGEGRVGFRTDASGRVTHLFESRSIAKAYERVPWYGTVGVQLAWLLACVLGFLAQVVGTLVGRIRRAPDAPRPSARGIDRAMVAVGAANLAFLVGLAFTIAGAFGSLEYGVPAILPALLVIPLLTTAGTLAAAVATGWKLTRSGWAGLKVSTALKLALALAYIPWLAYWNLLGFHY
jgi:CubicO group peptidase (beta-lactamase class C family)